MTPALRAILLSSVSPLKYTGPAPFFITLSTTFTMWGDSLTAGAFASPYEIWRLLQGYTSGLSVINQGIGGQTSAEITARVVAGDPAQLAGNNCLEMGRNDLTSTIGTADPVPGIMANYATSVAAIVGKGGSYVVVSPPNADIEPFGDPAWAQCVSLHRNLVATYPTKTMDWRNPLIWAAALNYGPDQINVVANETPATTRTLSSGVVNSLHMGRKGDEAIAYPLFLPWLRARDGGTPYAFPYQEVQVTGAAAATARTLNGLVSTARFEGTPASCILLRSTLPGAVIASDGKITNAGANSLTASYYEFWYAGLTAGGAITETGYQRTFIGASDTTLTSVKADGIWFATQPGAPSGLNSQKMSGVEVFSCATGTDGTSMFLIGNENFGRFTIERNVNNRFRVIGKDNSTAPGTSIAVLQSSPSGAGLITAATGEVWVFWSFDINAGTPLSQIYINDTSAQAAAVLTQGATVFLNNRSIQGAQSQANANPFKGTRKFSWVANDYIDWSVQARRDEARGTLTSNFAINGIVPFICFGGTAADWAWGNNRGTGGGTFVTALPQGSSFA